MQRPSSLGESQNQTAWPILVVRVVLYDLTAVGYRFLQLPDGDIADEGLIDRVLGELILTALYLASDFRKHVHTPILLRRPLLVNPPSLLATMAGNFQDGSVPGKLQFGSAWWFLDQKDGMEDQMRTLASVGLLSRFVGMLTDSRSFLSYPRHEYFRRVLCNLLGGDVEAGLLPNDLDLLGRMVEDISFNNARNYFPMECA